MLELATYVRDYAAPKTFRRAFFGVLLSLLLGTPAVALVATVPGGYATLQAAVTAVQGTPGASVVVNSNATYAENVQITQSVQITAGAGFAPVIRPTSGVPISIHPNSSASQSFGLSGLRVEGSGVGSASLVELLVYNSGAVSLTVDRTHFSNPLGESGVVGLMLRNVIGAASKDVIVRDSDFVIDTAPGMGANAVTMYGSEGPSRLDISNTNIRTTGGGTGIEVRGGRQTPVVPTSLALINSTITTAAPNGPYQAIAVLVLDDVNTTIADNHFNFVGNSASNSGITGIQISGRMERSLSYVDRNQFVGTGLRAGSGVYFAPFANGSGGSFPPTSGELIFRNNVLRNVSYGLFFNPQEGDTATVGVNHNTIDGATTCLGMSANIRTIIQGAFTNNLCTHISGGSYSETEGGAELPAGAIEAYVAAGAAININFANNGYFANPKGNYAPIVASIPNVGEVFNADPRYANLGDGDLRLQVGSPAIDAGSVTGLLVDNNGDIRPQGAAPDIGAYEGGVSPVATSITPVPVMSVPALATMAALLLGIALVAVRRKV